MRRHTFCTKKETLHFLLLFFSQGCTWLVEYDNDKAMTRMDTAAVCSSHGGALATSHDQSCFPDGQSGWITEKDATSTTNNDCEYFDGMSISTTKCSTQLPFYCKTYASTLDAKQERVGYRGYSPLTNFFCEWEVTYKFCHCPPSVINCVGALSPYNDVEHYPNSRSCDPDAVRKFITNGSQKRLSSLNIKIENHNSFRIRLQTCAMSEISLHTIPEKAVYTVRIGEQNSEKYRNIIIYKTENSNTELINASVVSFNETCDQYQWYTIAWRENSGDNFLYFYHGQDMATADLASVANMTYYSALDLTLSSYVGKVAWYIYAPSLHEETSLLNNDQLINMSPTQNIVAFELKTCNFGKITVMSVSGKYTYEILIDGIADLEGRSVYIRDTATNNVTRITFPEDNDECSNYRFYWMQFFEVEDDIQFLISRKFEEFHRAVLLSDSEKNEVNVVTFHGILRDSRTLGQSTNDPLGEWNFYDDDVICNKDKSGEDLTVPLPTPIVSLPLTIATNKPFGTNTISVLTIEISTADPKHPLLNKPLSLSMEENESGRTVQIIAIGVGSAALILVGLGILIASIVIKFRTHNNRLDDHHHRKSLAGIVFPSDVTLSPVSLSRLNHGVNTDNVYNACAQERHQSYGELQNYLTLDSNSGQGHSRRKEEHSFSEDSIDHANLDEPTEDDFYHKI